MQQSFQREAERMHLRADGGLDLAQPRLALLVRLGEVRDDLRRERLVEDGGEQARAEQAKVGEVGGYLPELPQPRLHLRRFHVDSAVGSVGGGGGGGGGGGAPGGGRRRGGVGVGHSLEARLRRLRGGGPGDALGLHVAAPKVLLAAGVRAQAGVRRALARDLALQRLHARPRAREGGGLRAREGGGGGRRWLCSLMVECSLPADGGRYELAYGVRTCAVLNLGLR
eukprot:SAG31_NODE_857_length_11448_cov_15.111287_8_plen_226_part_00